MKTSNFFEKLFAGDNKLCHGFASKILLQGTHGWLKNGVFTIAGNAGCSFCERSLPSSYGQLTIFGEDQQGDDVLTLYQWNTHTAATLFLQDMRHLTIVHRRCIDLWFMGLMLGVLTILTY